MPLKITSTKDAHLEGVKLLIYGASGAGKTVLCSTAPNPLIISSESGLLSLAGKDIPVAEISNERDLKEAYTYAAKSDFDTICLDSVSDIAETILAEYKGLFTDGRQAYGKLNDIMGEYIRKFRDLKGKNVYFTAKEAKVDVNNVVIHQPMMPGQNLTNSLPYFFDCVIRLEANRKGERKLHTISTATQVCKDRSNRLDKTEEPNLKVLFDKMTGGQ